jgi:uncharacterized protein
MPFWIGLGAAIVAGLGVLVALFTFVQAWALVHPRRKPFVSHPRDHDIPHEEIMIASPAGKLAAWFLPGVNAGGSGTGPTGGAGRTLIALHGINDNREQWLAPALDLQKLGYTLLLLDFRGHGQSGGRHVTFGDRETEDVAAALDYLRSRGDIDMGRIGVMGLSLGAIAAIIAAAQLPEVRAVMAESAFPDLMVDLALAFKRFTGLPPYPFARMTAFWGQLITGTKLSNTRAIESIGKIAPRPVFIIGDLKDDLVVEPEGSQALYARAGEPKYLWQLPNVPHVGAYLANPQEYIRRLDEFFAQAL